MITQYTELDITTAETYGRDIVSRRGQLAIIRARWHLSIRRLAQLLTTASQVIARWEEEPESYKRMHSMTAVRLGILADQLDQIEQDLIDQGVTNPLSLLPIATVAGDLGLSPSSKLIREKCQRGTLTCYQLGRLGTYIPEWQADKLRRKEI